MHGKDHTMIHPDAGALLEELLRRLKDDGEDEVFRYIRKEVLKNR